MASAIATELPILPAVGITYTAADHSLRFVHRLQHFVAHARGDARIHINHPRIRNAGMKLPSERAARLRAHIVGKKNGHDLVMRLLFGHIRKAALGGSLRFQGKNLAVVAHQRDGRIGHLLPEGDVLRLADRGCNGIQVHRAGLVQAERRPLFSGS